jgi:uncharacterized membrane protein (UPF0127 family)
MKLLRPAASLMMLVVVLVACQGCHKPNAVAANGTGAIATQPEIDPVRGHLLHAQPKLPTVKVWLGPEEMVAEMARTQVQIATGMMFRTNMAENEAMIFVFPTAGPKNFYMRNCTVPLSAAYITPDGTIAEIVDLQPGDERGVQSRTSNLQFVLEVPQGWFTRHNISTGAVVRTEHGSLLDTFFRR